jgi:hypothetical protein
MCLTSLTKTTKKIRKNNTVTQFWAPEPEWDGQDAYVVGGGSSLSNFDWSLICGKNTIGCNAAFSLGAHIIKIVLFADEVWWKKVGHKGTEDYGGRVVACSPRMNRQKIGCPWLQFMHRHSVAEFSAKGPALGWAGNTGFAAINLALILGAKRVFLLGFDMKLGPTGRANFHDLGYEPPKAQVYQRFLRDISRLSGSLGRVFPGREVWNVNDSSELKSFPTMTMEEHFGKVLV